MDEEVAELQRKAMAIEPDNVDVCYALGLHRGVSTITLGHWIFCGGPAS